ncbi:MAG: type II/IV secretion system protein, partial [Candidatus Omnitrophica bacterium]|nr:type II/IV secretion system protein [Candidatus Omnitrophota bacterium]
LTLDQVTEALAIQEKTSGSLGKILVELGYLEENQLLQTLAEQFNIPYVNLRDAKVEREAVQKMPAKLAFHYKALPLALKDQKLTLLVSNPLDRRLFDELQTLLACEISLAIGHEDQIVSALEEHYGLGAETLERLETKEKTKATLSTRGAQVVDSTMDEGSIVKLVNQLLVDARKSRASDIHLEPYVDEFRVRYRVDGVLFDAKIPPAIKEYQASIISRIKVMANLDIAEKRLPQDGRIKIRTGNEEVDLRISILPTSYGEAAVIRILSPAQFLNLDKLGLSPENLALLRQLLKRPYGIIFMTGPTGSGKTTTLYSCLSELNDQHRKIITIEDPIEYQLKGIVQIQVHPKIGLTFSQGLRHLLRHDPDVMMVGEVRDVETAEITIRTSLTGHLVFSTLHTNDSPGAIARLLDMGLEPYLVSSSVIAIIAQRLVRVICPKCKHASPASESGHFHKLPAAYRERSFFAGKGCDHCRKTGFVGRTAIHEIMPLDEELQNLIALRVSSGEIRKLAQSNGMKSLLDDGLQKAASGLTTPDEVFRVMQAEEK